MGSDASRLRQRLGIVADEHRDQVDSLLHERGPLIRGSFGMRHRVCGNPTCRCARGERHASKYLSAAVDGQARQVHVPAADEVRVAEGVERYRRFWQGRRRIAHMVRREIDLIEALGRSLLAPYPPDNPLPPPQRRGRRSGKSKKKAGGRRRR